MICPHCNIGIKFEHKGSELSLGVDFREKNYGHRISWGYCPACEQFIVLLEEGQLEEEINPAFDGDYTHIEFVFIKDNKDTEYKSKIIYPKISNSSAPMPIHDMPEEIKIDFMEARAVVDTSPRAAAALLRLCVQKLMPLLGEKGKDIDGDIASLVKKGLPVKIQQALDTLRVIGNESVHPGTFNLNDDRDTAIALFGFLNLIVDHMISEPKRIEEAFNKIPKPKRDAIAKRDGK